MVPGRNVLHIFNDVPTPWYDLGVFSQVILWVGRLLGNVKEDRCCDFVYYLPFMEFCMASLSVQLHAFVFHIRLFLF